jgi:hypothetical protein
VGIFKNPASKLLFIFYSGLNDRMTRDINVIVGQVSLGTVNISCSISNNINIRSDKRNLGQEGLMLLNTLYWVLLTIGAYLFMFLLVPPQKELKMVVFSFWMGLIQAVVVLWLGQVYFRVFHIVGSPTILGIPILVTISWVPLSIIFGWYFRRANSQEQKAGYIGLFAVITAVAQYLLELAGLWINFRWNAFYTFILALVTHSLMAAYLKWGNRNKGPFLSNK